MSKIDLSKNQLVEGDVLILVSELEGRKLNKKYKRYVHSIDHGLRYPFICFSDGHKRSDMEALNDNRVELLFWGKAELIEPKYRVKDFYSLVETLKNEGYKEYEFLLDNGKREIQFMHEMFKLSGKLIEEYEETEKEYLIVKKCGGYFFNYDFKYSWIEEVYEK